MNIIVKRSRFLILCAAFVYVFVARADVAQYSRASNIIFAAAMDDFSDDDYRRAIGVLFESFEAKAEAKISPKDRGKVGIKIYTNSGPGLATPIPLTRAVINELLKRGYKKSDICLVDMNRRRMRNAGYLPKYSDMSQGVADDFEGVPVVDIESARYFDRQWFYDNPLMPRDIRYNFEDFASNISIKDYSFIQKTSADARKSFLPVPLFLTVDFWINLPAITDMEGLGVSAALANCTLWNMSNNERFFTSPANAPIAVAEVAAIPELWQSLIFTIMSFERAQYVGANIFNSGFTVSQREVALSTNMAALDFLALDLINRKRVENGFPAIVPLPPIFEYVRQMGLGDWEPSKIKIERVSNAK